MDDAPRHHGFRENTRLVLEGEGPRGRERRSRGDRSSGRLNARYVRHPASSYRPDASGFHQYRERSPFIEERSRDYSRSLSPAISDSYSSNGHHAANLQVHPQHSAPQSAALGGWIRHPLLGIAVHENLSCAHCQSYLAHWSQAVMTPEGQSVLQQIDSFYASRVGDSSNSELDQTLSRVRSDLDRVRRERHALRRQLADVTQQLEAARADLSETRLAQPSPFSTASSRKREREETVDELAEPSNKRVASMVKSPTTTPAASSSGLAPPVTVRTAASKPAKPVNVITPPSAESTRHEVALFCYFVQRPAGIVENAEGHLSIQHLKGYMILRPYTKLPPGPKQSVYRLVACPGLYSLSLTRQSLAVGSTKQLLSYQGPSQNATVHTVAAWLANQGVTHSEIQEACAYAQATIQHHTSKPSPTLDWLATAEWVTHWRNAVGANASSLGALSLWWKPPKQFTPHQRELRANRLAKFPLMENYSGVSLLPMAHILPPSPPNVKELYLSDAVSTASANPMATAAVSAVSATSEIETSNTEASVAAGTHGSATGPATASAVAEVAPSVDAIMTGLEEN
jgi:hypothetical protein